MYGRWCFDVSSWTEQSRLLCCSFINIQMSVRFVQFLRRWYTVISSGRYHPSFTSLETQLEERFASLLMTLEVVLNVFTYDITGGDCVGNVARIGEMINSFIQYSV